MSTTIARQAADAIRESITDMKTPDYIEYSKLPHGDNEPITCIGYGREFPDGRQIIIALPKDRDQSKGAFFTITRPIEGGKTSRLQFRLSTEATHALYHLIGDKMIEHYADSQNCEQVKNDAG